MKRVYRRATRRYDGRWAFVESVDHEPVKLIHGLPSARCLGGLGLLALFTEDELRLEEERAA